MTGPKDEKGDDKRRDEVLKRMLATPPKPHDEQTKKRGDLPKVDPQMLTPDELASLRQFAKDASAEAQKLMNERAARNAEKEKRPATKPASSVSSPRKKP